MSRPPRLAAVAVLAVALALVSAVAIYLTGRLTGNGLNASDVRHRQFAEATFGGPEDGLQTATEEAQSDPAEAGFVLRSDGTPLAAVPPSLRSGRFRNGGSVLGTQQVHDGQT